MVVDGERPAGGRTLRFTGGRFSAERLSDEAFAAAAKSLVAFREAVVELAKQEHQSNRRSSEGGIPATISGFHFCVTDLRGGSLEVEVRPDTEQKMFEVEDPCSRSADRIETAIDELGRDSDGNSETLPLLSTGVLLLIAKIGTPFNDSEAVSFTSRRGTARLGRHECEALRRPRSMWDVPLDLVAGRVLRVSADRSRASVSVLGWQAARPTSIYYKGLATIDDMKVALTEDDETGSLVTVAGPFIWSAGKLKPRGSASSLQEVKVHDKEVAEQMNALVREIDELQELDDGWYDTDGVDGSAPHAGAILGARRLIAAFPHYGLPYPHVFPAVDGGVSMEWTLGDVEASIRFEDSSDTATVASWDASTDEHRYEEDINVDCSFVRDWLLGFTGQPAR
ncbi:hypothetical protein [Candidatus Poriferisodalis sp.]|uniref:hypothetical protein n=1 Tax=Candidatus Poriferisodalis sp. TaxID=3101277 RepID=UPI003B52EB42